MTKKKLVVCESPAKIKNIQKYVGDKYIVVASYGHISDLNKKQLSVDLENNFEPTYIVSDGKEKVVRDLKQHMKQCDVVYLASDYDREGEAIAWHIAQALKLKPENSKRIIFTEITKSAILNSIANPTSIDINMFHSQQARRVLDRIIGYLISPILWKQIQSSYKEKKSLSAGRVQSVVVKLIIERENEINKFESQPYFRITGDFLVSKINLKGELNSEKNIDSKKKALKFLTKCQTGEFFIDEIKTKNTKRKPPQPFITSSLQQEASSKLGISPKETMAIAQKLYENGHITYMRTDSLILSDEAHQKIKDKVIGEFGEDYYHQTKSKSQDKNAQEAHEACRPTDFTKNSLHSKSNITYRENRLYKLIWNRTIMSQMKPADVKITSIKIKLRNEEKIHKYHFISKQEFITFDGFLKVNEYQKQQFEKEILGKDKKNVENVNVKDENDNDNTNENDEDNDNQQLDLTIDDLKKIKKDSKVSYTNIKAEEKFSKAPQARFTEASIIKKLDELGIGRPSTYATMVSNVQDRNYIVKKSIPGKEVDSAILTISNTDTNEIKEKIIKQKKGGEKDKLFPTDIGEIVNKFLLDNFPEILDYKFTAHIENQLDEIAKGNIEWHQVVGETYEIIKPKLEEMKVSLISEKDKYKRVLGNCPDTDYEVLTYIGKFGPLVQLKDPNNNETRFSPLGDLKMEDVTLEQALQLLKYPLNIGEYKKKDILISKGKYGFYIKYNKKNYTIGEDYNPEELTLKDARKIIKEKDEEVKSNSKSVEYKGEKLDIKSGRYGPYLTYKGKNYSIYKTYDIDNLSEEDITKIISYKKEKSRVNKKDTVKDPKNDTKTNSCKKEKKTNNNGKKVIKKKKLKKEE